ncbi:SOS response-associated peptidase [Maritalea sp.]|uniref:SOS response-associated peptidase n=1 Tax=Maritalea sp. TaxID=2003361 RepID=UPI003EF26AEA
MCGRLILQNDEKKLREFFTLSSVTPFPPRYNIAPTQPVLTIVNQPAGRDAVLMRWGLVPHWVKDPRDFSILINARIETILDKPSFKSSIKNQRCIVPASGYYEWLRRGDDKQPFHISRNDGEMLALAGIYSTWEGPNGEEVDTMAILTQEATGKLADIHHRTPVHLDEEQAELWLDTKSVNAKEALTLVQPLERTKMRTYPVSKNVNNARNEGEELIKPISLDEVSSNAATKKPAKSAPPKDQLDLF